MLRHIAVLILTVLLSVPAQARELVWSDEFDTDGSPDPAKWTYEEGFVRNHEAQWYDPAKAVCSGGVLVIEAAVEDTLRLNPGYREGDDSWRNREFIDLTSACLTTQGKFDFMYGSMEVRAKIPTGPGAWPAIWLLGSEGPWPENGEIDVMEYYRIDGVPHILANACWGSDEAYKAVWDSEIIPFSHFTGKDPGWASEFHVWRMDWDTDSISIYLDDELLNEIPLAETVNGSIGGGSNAMQNRKYILLNLAVGGDHGGSFEASDFPQRYEIDYVRVYRL